jgi:hypothetical protein
MSAQLPNFRRTDGTGWIPVNFDASAGGSPFAVLPIDPVNNVSHYYIYVTGGSWELTASFEASRNRPADQDRAPVVRDGGDDMFRYEIGNNLKLAPPVSIRHENPSAETPIGFPFWHASWMGGHNPGPSTTRVVDPSAIHGAHVVELGHTVDVVGPLPATVHGHIHDRWTPVVPGETVTIGVWVKAMRANVLNITVVAEFVDSAGHAIGGFWPHTSEITLQPVDGWVWRGLSLTIVPANAERMVVGVRAESQSTAGALLRIDMLQIVRGSLLR